MNKNIRVGAIMDSNNNQVRLFGFGTYVGDETGGPMGDIPNPKIVLDSGKVVWGCECWWGPEEEIRKHIGTKTIVEVDIDAEKAKATGQ